MVIEADLGWLLRAVNRRHTTFVNDMLACLPGGVRGYWILTIATSSAQRQNDVGRRVGIDRTVMTHLLDDLEKADLVRRVRDTTDRRAHLIQATELGQSTAGRLAGRIDDAERRLLLALKPAEQVHFRALLRRLAVASDPSPAAPTRLSGLSADAEAEL